MKNAANNNCVNCIACSQKRRPAKDDPRSQYCQECADELEVELIKPIPALTAVPAGFGRNDARIDL